MATTTTETEHPNTTTLPSNPSTNLQSTKRTTFHIGTRRSALALAQADICHALLSQQNPQLTFPIHAMATMGDKNQTTALHAFNAKSLWTHELEHLLLTHGLDVIVHSLKDMPTQLPAGCILGAALNRAERRDCVAMSPANTRAGKTTLADLRPGEVVGTSSVRRGAQVRRLFPHLVVKDVRGNVGSRLQKLDAEGGEYGCLILAATGIQRVGRGDRVSSFLSRQEGGWLGAVGQGALGVEIRQGDEEVEALMAGLMGEGEGREAGERCLWECLAERSMLRTLEGGCSVPIGVETEWIDTENGEGGGIEGFTANRNGARLQDSSATKSKSTLSMHAIVLSVDGSEAISGSMQQAINSAEDADTFGWQMAQELVQKGAGRILEAITLNRKIIAEGDGA